MPALARTRRAFPLVLLLLLVGGCDGSDAATPRAAPFDTDGPLYALGVRFVTADTTVGYLVTVPSIEPGATWNLERAVEVGQDAWLEGTRGEPLVLTASSRDPSVNRWRVLPDGSISQDAELTFANLGLARSREARGKTAIYLSDKAYFMSSDGQIVIWSPREMAVIGTIPFEVPAGLSPEGLFSGNDERVFMTVNLYEDDAADPTIYEHDVHLVEIDPRTDTIVRDSVEPRCNNLSSMSLAPDGTTYYSPDAPITSYQVTLGAEHGPKSCSLRIVPEAPGYDPGFHFDLTSLVGGRPAGGLSLISDEVAFLRVWHEELAPPLASDRSNYRDLMFAKAYQWWRWPVGAPEAELVPGQLSTTGQWDLLDVDGRKLLPVVDADFSSTELVELLPDGSMQPLISGPGTLLGVVRVR